MKSKKRSVASWVKSGIGRRIVFLVLLVSIWDAVFRLGLYDGFLMPSPEEVVSAFIRGVRDGSFLTGVAVSMRRILIGYGISLVVGVGLGLAIGRFKLLEEIIGSLVFGLKAMPRVCWLPFWVM